jgi:chemotaxis protein MotB
MESNGIRPSQVVQVRGYANRKLRKPQQPNDASNRRITVIIQYVVNPAQAKVIVSNGTLPAVR